MMKGPWPTRAVAPWKRIKLVSLQTPIITTQVQKPAKLLSLKSPVKLISVYLPTNVSPCRCCASGINADNHNAVNNKAVITGAVNIYDVIRRTNKTDVNTDNNKHSITERKNNKRMLCVPVSTMITLTEE
jgi:hypothetical protein